MADNLQLLVKRALDHLPAQEMATHSAKIIPTQHVGMLNALQKLNQTFGQGTGAQSPRSGFLHMLLT